MNKEIEDKLNNGLRELASKYFAHIEEQHEKMMQVLNSSFREKQVDPKANLTEQEFIDGGYTTWPRVIAEMFEDEEIKDKIQHVAIGGSVITWRKALKHPAFTAWFYPGFGGIEGEKFTAWSKEWVYFPVTYDGSEWVGRVPRKPCLHATMHMGG